MQIDLKNLDIVEFRDSLQELRNGIEQDLKDDPSCAEDAVPLLTSIIRLQNDLAGVKSSAEFQKTKFLQCVPDLTFVMQCLNQILPEDDEDFDDDELIFDDEELDEDEDDNKSR